MPSVSILRASVLALGLALFPASEGRTIDLEKRQAVAPLNPPDFNGWGYMGCYSDSTASRTLAIAAHFGEHVDDDNCVYQCIQLGYIFAGVEYSGQCYCGNYINPIAVPINESFCYMPCTKTPTEACGGPNAMNLYYEEDAIPSPAPVAVSTNPGPDGWVSEGCYSDEVGARTLANQVSATGGATAMSVALCVEACQSAGYTLAGVEYADQCYCDDIYTNGAPYSSLSNCDMSCSGNSSEYCGGPGALNLYSYQGATPVAVTVVVSTPTPVTTIPLPSAWATLGCYTDSVAARGLSHNLVIASLTVEKCITGCTNAGYTIAGVEYAGECYCDNQIENNQGQAYDSSAGCDMGCSGNLGETCGGAGHMNVYAAGPAWVQLGCYSDQVYSRTLTTQITYSGLLTVETCLSACQAAGFVYAGVEYSVECHCGNTFSNGGGPASDGNAGCSWACAGNANEICGGNSRLSMYEYINAAGVIASSNPSSTMTKSSPATSATSTTSGTPTLSPPAPLELPTGWIYSGCYVDQRAGRILSTQEPDSSTLTIESCISTCSSLNFIIAGLEYSSQCFCDDCIRNGGYLSSSDSNCAMTCSGNSEEVCGGPGLVSLYSSGTLDVAPVSKVLKTGLPETWVYKGCYADAIGDRDTGVDGVEIDSTAGMTAEYCLEQCYALGFDAAGTEYSIQCFCGTTADFTTASPALLVDSACNMVCSGDSTQLCGGVGAISFYTLS